MAGEMKLSPSGFASHSSKSLLSISRSRLTVCLPPVFPALPSALHVAGRYLLMYSELTPALAHPAFKV